MSAADGAGKAEKVRFWGFVEVFASQWPRDAPGGSVTDLYIVLGVFGVIPTTF